MKTALIVKMKDGHSIGDEYPMDQGRLLIQRWMKGEFKDFIHITMPGGWEWSVRVEDVICIQTAFIQEQPQQGPQVLSPVTQQHISRRPAPGASGMQN